MKGIKHQVLKKDTSILLWLLYMCTHPHTKHTHTQAHTSMKEGKEEGRDERR